MIGIGQGSREILLGVFDWMHAEVEMGGIRRRWGKVAWRNGICLGERRTADPSTARRDRSASLGVCDFLSSGVVCGRKAPKSICQEALPGFLRLRSGQALRLRAIKPSVWIDLRSASLPRHAGAGRMTVLWEF